MQAELKPCPFCGSPARVEYDSGNENWNQKWWVACTSMKCGASTRAFSGSNTWGGLGNLKARDAKAKQDAKDFWNRRPPKPPPAASSVHITAEDIAKSGDSLAYAYANKIVADKLAPAASAGQLSDEQREALAEAICWARDDGLPGTADHLRAILAGRSSSPVEAGAGEVVAWGTRLPSGKYHAVRTDERSAQRRTDAWNIRFPKPPHAVTVPLCECAAPQAGASAGGEKKPLTICVAASDGECWHVQCPQIRDGEPAKSGRHCPLDNWSDDE